jgi:ribulose-phosphate 3-epimerase
MMVQNPERYIDDFADAGADIIGVHTEATPHIHRALQMIKNRNVKAEVVINPGTPVSAITPVLYMVDQVLVMTVNPGFGGQKFLPETVKKIAELDKIKKEQGLNFDIEIDGGVNETTVVGAYKAGATVAVAGSYIFDADDPVSKIKALKDATR